MIRILRRIAMPANAMVLFGFSVAGCHGSAFSAPASQPARSFELVYYSKDPAFNGRTDFRPRKGDVDIGIDKRIQYLDALAKRIRTEAGGEEALDKPAVPTQ